MNLKVAILVVISVLLVPLIAYSEDLNMEFRRVAAEGDIATVKTLLSKGADVDTRSIIAALSSPPMGGGEWRAEPIRGIIE